MSTISSSTTSGSSVLTALGGSGTIDTGALITNLVSATFDPKTAALKAKETANTAKVSQLATLTAGIDSFSTALQSLISGGTLFTQPTSSDSNVLTAAAKPGAAIGTLSAQLTVRQLAQGQSLVSGTFANAGSAIGTGTLTLVGNSGTTRSFTIDATNNSLAGIARTINAAAAGITATVVTDAGGARLTFKGSTGADGAFKLAVSPNSDGGLAALAYGINNGMAASGGQAVSTSFADPATSPVGQGSFTLTGPGGTATIAIDAASNSLNGMAAAINAAGTGLTATVTSDINGYHLAIGDGSGTLPAFTLAPAAGAQAGLARFTWPAPAASGMTLAQGAQDAIVRMDGVDITRGSNVIDDLVDGVTLTLKSAAPAQTISLGATRPTAAIKQAVSDFVAAYNEMKAALTKAASPAITAEDGTTAPGPLYGNSAVRQMQTQLSRLPSTILNTAGGPRSLAEIGVSTNRDGTLTLDDAVLAKALAATPDAVEAMFNPTQHASSPLIRITSAYGAVAPGTYALTDIVAQSGSTSASGKIDGAPLVTTGSQLYASVSSAASGLKIDPQGDIASATITVDLGLGGALKAIRDGLRGTGGVLAALSTQLTSEQTDLADMRTRISADQTTYEERLTRQFATMNTNVAQYSAIKSYLTQQIAVWTKSDS